MYSTIWIPQLHKTGIFYRKILQAIFLLGVDSLKGKSMLDKFLKIHFVSFINNFLKYLCEGFQF